MSCGDCKCVCMASGDDEIDDGGDGMVVHQRVRKLCHEVGFVDAVVDDDDTKDCAVVVALVTMVRYRYQSCASASRQAGAYAGVSSQVAEESSAC